MTAAFLCERSERTEGSTQEATRYCVSERGQIDHHARERCEVRAQRLADRDQQRVQIGTRRGGARKTETVCRGKQLAQPHVRRHQRLHTLVPTQTDLVGVLGETGEDGGEEGEREVRLGNHVEEDEDEVGSQK